MKRNPDSPFMGFILRIGLGLCLLSLPLSATPSSGLLKASVPAAPTELMVSVSQTSAGLEWKDNSSNETEFRVELKLLNGTFQDIGAAADSSADVPVLQPDTIYTFRVRARNAMGYSAYSNEVTVSTLSGRQFCEPGPQALCLQNSRFKVKAFWRIGQGPYNPANAVPMTSDTGHFWFFDSANVEMVVKVLYACTVNGKHWVFAGGLTDVGVVWTVTDTQTGFVRTYVNPAGTAFAPVQDTSALFCP